MPLPTNIDIPAWVKWAAQDENGSWWGFSVEPLEHSSGWYENEVGKYVLLLEYRANRNQLMTNWQETLVRVNS